MEQAELRSMRADEREAVLDLLEEAFGLREIFARYMDHDPSLTPGNTWLALQDDRPISCVQIFSKRIRLRGETVSLGGIGSVGTARSHRKRGLATRLLERALEELRGRDVKLALLFTGLRGFYERFGFVRMERPRWEIHRPRPLPELPPAVFTRDFASPDLGEIRSLYEGYSLELEGSTARDLAYWEGQIRYAGNPEELFRLVTRRGEVVAYARTIEEDARTFVIELARVPDAADELASLLCSLAPTADPLLCPALPDAELRAALAARTRVADGTDPDEMWRVIDRPFLTGLCDLPPATTDDRVIRSLVGGLGTVYWWADRF